MDRLDKIREKAKRMGTQEAKSIEEYTPISLSLDGIVALEDALGLTLTMEEILIARTAFSTAFDKMF